MIADEIPPTFAPLSPQLPDVSSVPGTTRWREVACRGSKIEDSIETRHPPPNAYPSRLALYRASAADAPGRRGL